MYCGAEEDRGGVGVLVEVGVALTILVTDNFGAGGGIVVELEGLGAAVVLISWDKLITVGVAKGVISIERVVCTIPCAISATFASSI